MLSHIFFDLDDTLIPSRTPMKAEHIPLFVRLCAEKDVLVVSGAEDKIMQQMLPKEAAGMYYRMTQNGNYTIAKDGSVLWTEKFSKEQEDAIYAFIKKVHDDIALPVTNENDLVEHRGSQICYSLIGHNEDRTVKKAFDPGGVKRLAIVRKYSTEVNNLQTLGIEVVVGGSTSLDIYLLGKNKGYHIARLVEQEGWRKEDCVYVGDALEPGRNDETVVGVIPTKSVESPDDTFNFIKEMLS